MEVVRQAAHLGTGFLLDLAGESRQMTNVPPEEGIVKDGVSRPELEQGRPPRQAGQIVMGRALALALEDDSSLSSHPPFPSLRWGRITVPFSQASLGTGRGCLVNRSSGQQLQHLGIAQTSISS